MAIKAGDKMPAGTFKTWGKDGPQDLTTDELFKGKTVVLFSVPGAFTPTCSAKHVPSYLANYDRLKAKGVDFRVCRFTLERNKIDPGKVLPEATLVPSGVAEVARLQFKEGFAYLRP